MISIEIETKEWIIKFLILWLSNQGLTSQIKYKCMLSVYPQQTQI